MAKLYPTKYQFSDSNGDPVNSGTVGFYVNTTSTLKAVYTDTALSVAATNPQPLDSAGRFNQGDLYGSGTYTVVLKDSSGNQIWTEDDLELLYPTFGTFNVDDGLFRVATLAALQALTVSNFSNGDVVFMASRTSANDGAHGEFTWTTGDQSANVTADEVGSGLGDGGIWIAPSSDLTGASGAWKRNFVGFVASSWYGLSVQAAHDGFGLLGGDFDIPVGTISLSNTLNLTQPFRLFGRGVFYSAINSSSPSEAINVTPDSAVDLSLSKIENLTLSNPSTGSLGSGSGIKLNTSASDEFLPKLTIRDVFVGGSSGYGIHHLNNIANVQGGMYGGRIENSVIKGGIKFELSGDSNSVSHSIISGDNIGVYANLQPGASLLSVNDCNITNSSGAIRVDAGSRFRLTGNNTENTAAGALSNNSGASWNITGLNGTIYGGVILENLISRFGSSDATHLLKIDNCIGTLIQDNVFLSDSGSTTSIEIGSNCQNVRIGPNTYNSNVQSSIVDNGVGTAGIVKQASLQNSWVDYSASDESVSYIKDLSGMVHISGQMKGGTTTNGTTIFTLPTGFRPGKIVRAIIMFNNAGTPTPAQLNIESDGTVSITYITNNAQVMINVSFAASDLANAVSSE